MGNGVESAKYLKWSRKLPRLNTVVVGLQYGDEGKGKIIDYLCRDGYYRYVARYQGGNNAGHTVYLDNGKKVVLHQVPSGIFSRKTCFIGNGCVVDIDQLNDEIKMLSDLGVDTESNIYVSPRAHVITKEHVSRDKETNGHIGTTNRGIGPAYEDKVGRKGLRVMGLSGNSFPNRFCVEDLVPDMIASGGVIFEGAQGTMLDVDHGTYPYVTSSNCTAGGAATGTGFPPHYINNCIGVAKAYTTRVGSGHLPYEWEIAAAEDLRQLGGEFGATTGRPRRIAHMDLKELQYAIRINGCYKVYLTKLDVLYQYGSFSAFGLGFSAKYIPAQGLTLGAFVYEVLDFMRSTFPTVEFAASFGPNRMDILE